MGTVTYTGPTTSALTNGLSYDLVSVGINSSNGSGIVVLDNNGGFTAVLSAGDYTVTELFGVRKVV